MFFLMYLVGFLLVLGGDDWFIVWVGLEINMMSFISIVFDSTSWETGESMYKYFFIQSISSALFLVSIVFGWEVVIPLFLSIGAGVFYFWFPSVVYGVSWFSCYLLMTLQKFLPLVLLSLEVSKLGLLFGIISMLVGVLGSYGQVMTKIILGYSSINHLGWMMVSQIFGGGLWIMYFFMYMVVLGIVVMYFSYMEIDDVVWGGFGHMLVVFFMMLNMGGMPPMFGFVMKWVVLDVMVGYSIVLSMIMVVCSLVMIYVYVRMIYDMVMGELIGVSFLGGDILVEGSGLYVLAMFVGSVFFPFFLVLFN